MAMYDWNHNGKEDMADNLIEYQIYQDVTEQNASSYRRGRGSNVSVGKWWAMYIGALIIGYGINEFLGTIILIGLIFWLCVS